MYTIREVCSGALKLVRSMLNRKRKYQIQFNKEKDGCWYVDFPHWPFSHDNLAMVSGADKMLELLSDGELFVRVCVIPTKKQEKHDELLISLYRYQVYHCNRYHASAAIGTACIAANGTKFIGSA